MGTLVGGNPGIHSVSFRHISILYLMTFIAIILGGDHKLHERLRMQRYEFFLIVQVPRLWMEECL